MTLLLVAFGIAIFVLAIALISTRSQLDEARAELRSYEETAKAARNEKETGQHRKHT